MVAPPKKSAKSIETEKEKKKLCHIMAILGGHDSTRCLYNLWKRVFRYVTDLPTHGHRNFLKELAKGQFFENAVHILCKAMLFEVIGVTIISKSTEPSYLQICI